jgi:aldehyde:ferredoxin oxidoreductase
MAGYDTLGVCVFAGLGFAAAPEVIGDLLDARYGWQGGAEALTQLGTEPLRLEREFNRRAGFTAVNGRLPEWITRKSLPPHNTVFDVPDAEMDAITK